MDSRQEPAEATLRPPGRFRAAWQALCGAPVVPVQIRAQWATAQLELEAILDKITAATARQITRDKRELEKAHARLQELEGDCGCGEKAAAAAPGGSRLSAHKRELSRRVLADRGIDIDRIRSRRNGGGNVATTEAGEG